jgi:chromosome segregation ATPase
MLLSKVKTDLAKAEGQVASLKEELGAAKSARDELEQQVKQLTSEKDKAIAVQTAAGQETVKKLTDQLNEQTGKVTELQSQIGGLQKTIQDQQATITQQQATIGQLQKTIEELKRPPEPNAVTPAQP